MRNGNRKKGYVVCKLQTMNGYKYAELIFLFGSLLDRSSLLDNLMAMYMWVYRRAMRRVVMAMIVFVPIISR